MKRVIPVVILVLFVTAIAVYAADAPISVKGEVVDTACYAAMGAKGEGHAKCGIKCAKKGIPVGLVEEGKSGKMYVLLPGKDDTAMPSSVIDNMGKVVTVTGHAYSSGGNSFLMVESVK
jgi:hypothetical protein